MKLRDVRQYKFGNYRVTIDLAYLESALAGYVEDHKCQLDPDFQRDHVWTEEQQIAYCEHVLKGGKAGLEIYFNHEDWMNFRRNDAEMVLVDGKQRLTALRAMLRDEIPVFGHKLSEYEDAKTFIRGKSVMFNINNLPTRKEVLQWYVDMNAGGTVHTKEEIDKVKEMIKAL